MPLYRCKYIAATGAKQSKLVEADSLEEAKNRLLKEKVLVLELLQHTKREEKIKLDRSALVNFSRELGQLLKAGLPLYESLVTIEEKNRNTKYHSLFLDLCDQLKSGRALSDAMSYYSSSFDAVIISMVRSAEKTGTLAQGFIEITRLLEYQQQLRRQLIQSLTYPLFLGSFSVLIFLALMLFVVPSIRDLFQDAHLHPITKAVFGVSQFLQDYGWGMLVGLTVMIGVLVLLLKSPRTQYQLQILVLRLGYLRKIILHSALIIFCRTISLLVAGGVPLVEALKLTAEGIKYLPLKEALEETRRKILEGKSIGEELSRFSFIPPLLTRMISIAEKTGKFAEMTFSCAVIYQDELDRDLKKLTTYLQPILIIILGVVIGIVLLSILIPITDVGSMLNV